MKKLITYSVLMFTFFVSAQDLPDNSLDPAESNDTLLTKKISSQTSPFATTDPEESFADAAEENNIAFRTFSDLPEVYNGYYAITAVLSKTKNLKKIVKKLTKKGFGAGFINNPESGLNYIYLNHYTDWKEAIKDVSSDFNGTYDEDTWVMEVVNGLPMLETINNEDAIEEQITSVSDEEISVANEEAITPNTTINEGERISVFNDVSNIEKDNNTIEENANLEVDEVT